MKHRGTVLDPVWASSGGGSPRCRSRGSIDRSIGRARGRKRLFRSAEISAGADRCQCPRRRLGREVFHPPSKRFRARRDRKRPRLVKVRWRRRRPASARQPDRCESNWHEDEVRTVGGEKKRDSRASGRACCSRRNRSRTLARNRVKRSRTERTWKSRINF